MCKEVSTVLYIFSAVPVLENAYATTTHYTILLQWTLLYPNGIIRYYFVELASTDGSVKRSLTTQNTSILIDSLPPAMTFTIQVCGFTIACGDNYTITAATTGGESQINMTFKCLFVYPMYIVGSYMHRVLYLQHACM